VREIRTLRAMRRELETEPRRRLFGHEGGNPGNSQGHSYGPPRQFSTLPGSRRQKTPRICLSLLRTPYSLKMLCLRLGAITVTKHV
jgi:hypothetical protein